MISFIANRLITWCFLQNLKDKTPHSSPVKSGSNVSRPRNVTWVPWEIKPPAIPLCDQPIAQENITENTKDPCYWSFGAWIERRIPSQIASDAENCAMSWRHHASWVHNMIHTPLYLYCSRPILSNAAYTDSQTDGRYSDGLRYLI